MAIVEEIEIIYGRQTVKVDGLELGHPYIKLPVEVARHFETILKYKKEREFALVLRGKSMLDVLKYFGFNVEPPAEKWSRVKDWFKDFGTYDETLNGWLTCYPGQVGEILGCSIDSGL